VLITNFSLINWSGSETYVRDLALGLLRRGHRPVVYCPNQGPVAEALRAATVPVIDDLATLSETPDIIHAHHHPETMTALLHFGGVPAVFCCHGRFAWHDAPPRFPRIRRYLAVDETCRERLVCEHGIPEAEILVVLNSVDLARFRTREPLPERPRRALLFSHYASEHTHLPAVRDACTQTGLSLDVMGLGAGKVCSRPETVLGEYDLIFAKARCALEALAVGAAVVLCDATGVGGMVTAEKVSQWRRFNLGFRLMQQPLASDILVREIGRYDAGDAREVCRRVRAEAGLDAAVETLLDLYRTVIAEQRACVPDLVEEARAAALYLRRLSPWREIDQAHQRANQVELDRSRLQHEHLRVHAAWAESEKQWQASYSHLVGETERLRAEHALLLAKQERLHDEMTAENERLRDQLCALQGSEALHVGTRILGLPLLGRVTRKLLRRSA
jgi:hypothetical protein